MILICAQVGVIVLISVYMLSGAAMFHHVERDSLMQVAEEAAISQSKAAQDLWNITGESYEFLVALYEKLVNICFSA